MQWACFVAAQVRLCTSCGSIPIARCKTPVDVAYAGFAVCVMVLVAASCAEWKGRGAGDAAQVAREGFAFRCCIQNLVLAKRMFPTSNSMFSQISQQIAAYAFISFFEEITFRSYLPLTLAYGLSTGTTVCMLPTPPPHISRAKNKTVFSRGSLWALVSRRHSCKLRSMGTVTLPLPHHVCPQIWSSVFT